MLLLLLLVRVRINVSWFGKFDSFSFLTLQFFPTSHEIMISKYDKAIRFLFLEQKNKTSLPFKTISTCMYHVFFE